MKYSENQKYRVIQRKKSLNNLQVIQEFKLKRNFPIEVEIKDGFYIIESRMNNYDFTQL